MAGDAEFCLQWFFHNDTTPLQHNMLTAEQAVDMALVIIKREAAKRGQIRRVLILDGLDNVTFEWLFGHGIVQPGAMRW